MTVALHVLLTQGGRSFAWRPFHRAEGEIAQPLVPETPDSLLTRVLAAVIDRLVLKNHLPQVKTCHLARACHGITAYGLMTKIRREPAHQFMRQERFQANAGGLHGGNEGREVIGALRRRAAFLFLPEFLRCLAVDAEIDREIVHPPALVGTRQAAVGENTVGMADQLGVPPVYFENRLTIGIIQHAVFAHRRFEIIGNRSRRLRAQKHLADVGMFLAARQGIERGSQRLVEARERCLAARAHIAALYFPETGNVHPVVKEIGLVLVKIIHHREIVGKGWRGGKELAVLRFRQRRRSGNGPFTAGTHEEIDDGIDLETRLYRHLFRRLGAGGCAFLSRPALAPVPEVINQPHGAPPAPARSGRARRDGTS